MADDGNGNKDDAQVKNELKAIKAQVTATNNPAELSRLAGLAANLLSSTNNPQLIEQIKSTQSAIYNKEENAEQRISSVRISENIETREQLKDQQKAREEQEAREQELKERHERLERHETLKTRHAQIMQDSDEMIANQKRHNENVESVIDDLKNNKEPSLEKMKSCIKTDEQLKEEIEKRKALLEHQKHLIEHEKELQTEEDRIKKQQAQYANEAEKQREINKALPPHERAAGEQKLADFETKLKNENTKLEMHRPLMEETKKAKEEVDKRVEEYRTGQEKEEKSNKEFLKEMEEYKKRNPEKDHSALDDFSALMLNQIETTKTGEIKDSELRNEFLKKKNQAEIPTKFPQEIPPVAPDIERERIPLQAQSQQKNVPERTPHSIGDKVLESKEKHDPILEEEKANIKKELRNGLENQKPLPAKNKQTEATKQLNRTEQQTKKNKGPSI